MTDEPPPIARPVPPPSTRTTARIPTPPTPEPHDDTTPLRTVIPDHSWFPCPHCGKMNKCPPTAVEHARALERVTPIANAVQRKQRADELIAPELEPAPRKPQAMAPTKILRPDPPPDFGEPPP